MTISSFNSKIISLSPSAIIDLSIESLDCDDSTESSLTNDDGLEILDTSLFSGSFRWTDITKFADESPEAVHRKQSFGDQLAASFVPNNVANDDGVHVMEVVGSATSTTVTVSAKTNGNENKSPGRGHSTELGERISLLLNSPTNSPRSAMTGFWNNNQVVVRKTLTNTTHTTIIDDVVSLDEFEGESSKLVCASMTRMRV
jgi:hypothetical protein